MIILKIKEIFLTRNHFDFECEDTDLFKFHPQIRIFLVFNGIFFNNLDSYIRFCWPIISIMISLIGSSFELMFIYHGVMIEDYSFATECFCYFIIVTVVPFVYVSVLFNRKMILQILNTMDQDFRYICKLGIKYREPFLQGQLLIWQLCIIWFVFVVTVIMMYIASTMGLLFYQSLFATRHENMIRPLMFPFWLPADDPYRTPNYEMFLFWEIVICIIVLQTFCVYIYMLFHYLIHFYTLMSIIILDCEALFDGLDESVVELSRYDSRRIEVQKILNKRMGRIVTWHNSVFTSIEAISSVYGPLLVYQVMLSSIEICLMAYQVAESLDEGKLNIIFVALLIAICVQLWIPCYLGTLIRNKAFCVGEACWSNGWQETPLSRMVHLDMVMVIMRSQKPVSIKFTGLPNLELETFSSIMSSAYSYFNLLRQYSNKD